MKKIIITLAILLFATPSFAATFTLEVRRDGVLQESRVLTANEIKDVQIASQRDGMGPYDYFWGAMDNLFVYLAKQNFNAQVESEKDDIKARMRQ